MERELLSLAARIANPWDHEALPALGHETFSGIADILKRNRISFLSIARKFGDALRGTPFESYTSEEGAVFRELRGEFERIRSDLESRGIRTMLFKSTGLYPTFPHLSGNLDVLVEPSQGEEARKRLYALGYVELLNVEEPGKFLFRRFPSEGRLLFTFHLHEQIGWGVPFLDSDAVWAGVRAAADDPALNIPGPIHSLLTALSHWFYEEKALTLHNLFLTADALRQVGGGLEEAAHRAAERGWEDGVYSALEVYRHSWRRLFDRDAFDPDSARWIDEGVRRFNVSGSNLMRRTRYGGFIPAGIPFLANKVVYYKKLFRDRRRTRAEKAADFVKTLLWALRWKLHIRSQRPLVVALSGLDGAGKTIQSALLLHVFDTCDIRARIVWTRGASSRFIGFLLRLAGVRSGGASGGGASDKGDGSRQRAGGQKGGALTEDKKMIYRRRKLANPFIRFGFACAYALDLSFVYVLKVRIFMLFGRALICDRYVTDAIVDFALMTGTPADRPPAALRLLRILAPEPHASFLLDIEEAEALRRKPDEGGLDHLREAREMFVSLAASRGARIIDCHLTVGEIRERIAAVSLGAFYSRYRTVVNALLASNPDQINRGRWRA